MKIKNHLKKVAVGAILMSALTASAAGELPPWLNISGSVNFDGTSTGEGTSAQRETRIQDAEIRFEVLAREGVKLVIKAELEKTLSKYLKSEEYSSDLEKMIEEAYIEVKTDKLGLPQAIITVGKQRMAFGQRLAALPMFKDSLLYKLNNEEEMIGLTVALPAHFFKIVDSVALSLYETGAGDMRISEQKGFSVQMTKQLTQQIEMQISALMKQQVGAESETRESLGFVYTGVEGSFKIWAEGVMMSHNPQYLDSRYAGTVGAAAKVWRGVVVIEASMIEKAAHEIALAYNLPVGSNLVLSPEVRYITHANGETETVVGIRARLEFGRVAKQQVGPR